MPTATASGTTLYPHSTIYVCPVAARCIQWKGTDQRCRNETHLHIEVCIEGETAAFAMCAIHLASWIDGVAEFRGPLESEADWQERSG